MENENEQEFGKRTPQSLCTTNNFFHCVLRSCFGRMWGKTNQRHETGMNHWSSKQWNALEVVAHHILDDCMPWLKSGFRRVALDGSQLYSWKKCSAVTARWVYRKCANFHREKDCLIKIDCGKSTFSQIFLFKSGILLPSEECTGEA